MPILSINRKRTLKTDDVYFIHSRVAHEVMGLYTIMARKAETIWERITGYIFTRSGRPLMTKSGRMICLRSQLKK